MNIRSKSMGVNKSYCIWNSELLGNDLSSYKKLVKIETETQSSYSSVIQTSDIKGLISGVLNETNTELMYIEL